MSSVLCNQLSKIPTEMLFRYKQALLTDHSLLTSHHTTTLMMSSLLHRSQHFAKNWKLIYFGNHTQTLFYSLVAIVVLAVSLRMPLSLWRLRWHFTTPSLLQGHLTILKYCCHTAEHYGEKYDDWNSAVFRSQRNCSSDDAERTDDGRAFHARAAATGK